MLAKLVRIQDFEFNLSFIGYQKCFSIFFFLYSVHKTNKMCNFGVS